MSIQGTDNRSLITNFTGPGFNSIVAVDSVATLPTQTLTVNPSVGSGILIAPNFVLTSGHNFIDNTTGVPQAGGRITDAASVATLSSRPTTGLTPGDINVLAVNIDYPDGYDANQVHARDMALVETTGTIAATPIGMIAFMNPEDANNYLITTGGFPAGIVPGSGSINAGTVVGTSATGARVTEALLGYSATGSISSASADGRFYYSDSVDTEGGQSGSGVWTTLDDGTGTQVTAVLGVHNHGGTAANGGHLITKDEYDFIVDAMDGNSSAGNGASLPYNFIIGSDPGFFSFITGSGDDYIQGSYRKESIFGRDGDDSVEGGGADDRIFGGEGVDQALFSGFFADYDFTINDPNLPEFTFTHARGAAVNGTDTVREVEFAVFEYEDSDRDGVDDDGNVFFVPLQADSDDPTKIADGPGLTYEAEVRESKDVDAALIGTFSADLPAFTFDGDLDYELTIGAEQSILFNFAYIVDVSGSMNGTNLSETKAAYEALTNFLISDGVAARSEFAVIPFASSASLISGIDAQGAISAINGLNAGGGTSFGPALSVAENWFESLDTVRSATNIAYFLSDGQGSGASDSLQIVDETLGFGGVPVDVRAFGIGSGASISSLNTIDSNSAQFLNNPADLISAFGGSGVSRDTIDRIEVLLAGVVIDTISPSALVDDPLGLRFEGSLDGLDVGREADNDVVFRLIFNDGTPTTEVNARVTSGQEEVIEQSDDGTEVRVTFGVDLRDYDATALSESLTLVANDLSNSITLGDQDAAVEANGGDDTIIMGSGNAVIDGGDGVDTVIFSTTRDTSGIISRSGDVVSVGSQASLVNVEFIAFTDTIINTQTLVEAPVVSLLNDSVTVIEGDSGTKEALFTLSLAQASTSDSTISFATRDGQAEADTDYVASTGQVVIAAGQTEATVSFAINGDAELENDEAFFVDFMTDGSALFDGAQTMATSGVLIQTDDSRIDLAVVGDRFSFFEQDEGITSNLGLSLFRIGSISFEETVSYTVEGVGPNAVDADDFATPLSGTVTFASGQNSVALDIAVAGDALIEAAESFRIVFEGTDGGSNIAPTSDVFTIENDDEINNAPTADDDLDTTAFETAVLVDVLANDTDLDGTLVSSSLTITDGPDNGTAVVENGLVRYTPSTGFSGLDTLSYTVQDNDGAVSNEANVSITVSSPSEPPIPSNVAPNAQNDTDSTAFETAVLVDVLANDTDLDGTLVSSSLTITDGPDNGTAVVENGLVRYTPSTGFSGLDTLSYTVQDNDGAVSNEANVLLTVAEAPSVFGSDADETFDLVNLLPVSLIDGQGGLDTVVIPGASDEGQLVPIDGGFKLVREGEVSVDLLNIEQFRFEDGTLVATDQENAAALLRMYETFFDRSPDYPGLSFWFDVLELGSITIDQVGEFFFQSEEYQSGDPGLIENEEFLDDAYLIAFGRQPDTLGKSFWLNLLEQGVVDRADVLVDFSQSDEAVVLFSNQTDDGVLLFG